LLLFFTLDLDLTGFSGSSGFSVFWDLCFSGFYVLCFVGFLEGFLATTSSSSPLTWLASSFSGRGFLTLDFLAFFLPFLDLGFLLGPGSSSS
jgi:hypothetical protein